MVISAPTSTPQRNSTPISLRMSISAWTTSFSSRKLGMPFISMPPGRDALSNTTGL